MTIDVTDDTFETEVLAKSNEVPVIVDLWAPWCGPCRTLGPILEKVVDETGGRAVLVKINVDENPRASATFRVQSIPAVFALRNSEIVDAFIGAQPEAAVRSFVDALLPSDEQQRVAELVAKGDETALREALELDPANEPAIVALAEQLVAKASTEEALALLERIPETPATRRVAALARVGAASGEDSTPDDPLADIESRLDALLDQVKADEDARQQFVDLLELLGPDDPRTARYRKALTARLF